MNLAEEQRKPGNWREIRPLVVRRGCSLPNFKARQGDICEEYYQSCCVGTYGEISYDNRMAKEYTLKAISSLFEEKLSERLERSFLVKYVKAAESILREFETTTTTR